MDFFNALEDSEASEPADQEVRVQLTRLAIEAYRRGEIPRDRLMKLAKKLNNNNPRAAAEWVKLGEATRNE
jgi:3-methyladenine DNA glycosylase AlkD